MHGLIFETSICYWQDQPGILFRFFIVSRVWSTRAKAWLAPRSTQAIPALKTQNFFRRFFFTRLYIRSLEPEIGFIRDRSFSFSIASPSSTTHTHTCADDDDDDDTHTSPSKKPTTCNCKTSHTNTYNHAHRVRKAAVRASQTTHTHTTQHT